MELYMKAEKQIGKCTLTDTACKNRRLRPMKNVLCTELIDEINYLMYIFAPTITYDVINYTDKMYC